MIHYLYRIYHTARKFGAIPTKLISIFIVFTYYKRIVCNADYRYHSNVLIKELRILKLYDELKTAMIMYKANTKMLPLNIQRLFSVSQNIYLFVNYGLSS